MTDPTDDILRQIRRHGWAVSVHLMGSYVEMHGVKLDAPDDPPKVARFIGWDDESAQLKCALALAEMCLANQP